MKHIGSYEAKTHLPQLLDSVEAGQAFIITRHGRPAARLVPISPNIHDVRSVIAELQTFGARHRGKLRGLSARDLLTDGRRF
jgi:prevent-host-death family protein